MTDMIRLSDRFQTRVLVASVMLAALLAGTLAGCSSTSTVRVKPDEETSVQDSPPADTLVAPPRPSLAPPIGDVADTSFPRRAVAFAGTTEGPTVPMRSFQIRPAEDAFYVTTPTGRLAFDLPEPGETTTIAPSEEASAPDTSRTASAPPLRQVIRGEPTWVRREADVPEGAGQSTAGAIWEAVQSRFFWLLVVAAAGAIALRAFTPISLLTRAFRP